jgi:hypothetical protein
MVVAQAKIPGVMLGAMESADVMEQADHVESPPVRISAFAVHETRRGRAHGCKKSWQILGMAQEKGYSVAF